MQVFSLLSKYLIFFQPKIFCHVFIHILVATWMLSYIKEDRWSNARKIMWKYNRSKGRFQIKQNLCCISFSSKFSQVCTIIMKLFFFAAFYFIMTNYINRWEEKNKLDEASWLKIVRSLHIWAMNMRFLKARPSWPVQNSRPS